MPRIINFRYILMDTIGHGGMGVVHRATDRLSDHTLALKQIYLKNAENIASDSHSLQNRLTDEFYILSKIRHPNIISVLDYGFDTAESPYYTMSLLDKPGTLNNIGVDLTFDEQIDLFTQLLQAIAYLHRRGIYHCDLKPDNILVTQDRTVRLVDFGLATLRENTEPQEEIAGTLAYMAPEMFSGNPPTRETDLYAAGMIAFEMFAGQYPYKAKSTMELVSKILTITPDVTMLNIPVGVGEVIAKLIHRDASQRYHDAYDVIDDIYKALNKPAPPEPLSVRNSFLEAADFVGRQQELTQLNDALMNAMSGKGSIWLIGGPPGVGKSRLIDEIRARALVNGALVLRGTAIEDGGQSYQLWREPLRRLLLSAHVSDLDAGILKRIVPDINVLIHRNIAEASRLDDAEEKQRLVGVITSLFYKYDEPIVLLLENLQWVTESLEPLKQIANIVQNRPILIIGTYRMSETPELPQEIGTKNVLELSHLSSDEIRALSVSMLGEAGEEPEVVNYLEAQSGGNAFHLIETVRALAEEAGQLRQIPMLLQTDRVFLASFDKLVARRLSQVPDHALHLLRIASLMGREIDLKVLRQIVSPKELDAWVITCSNALVIEVEGDKTHFTHDQLIQQLQENLDLATQADLSQQLAEAIEKAYPGDQSRAASLTRHWRQAGNIDKEKHYTRIYLEQLQALSDYKVALQLADRLQEISGEEDIETRLFILLSKAKSHQGMGDFDQAETLYTACRDLAREHDALPTLAAAVEGLGNVTRLRGDYDPALAQLSNSLDIFRKADDKKSVARVLKNIGIILSRLRRFPEAVEHFNESWQIATEVKDDDTRAACLNNLGIIAYYEGDFDKVLENFTGALDIRRRDGNRRGIVLASHNLGAIARQQGDYNKARSFFTESLEIAQEIGDLHSAASCQNNLGYIALMGYELSEGCRFLKDALTTVHKIQAVPLLLEIIVGYAEYNYQLGDMKTAARWLGLVLNHDAAKRDVREVANPLVERIKADFGEEAFDKAFAAGQSLDLDDLVAVLLDQEC